ncbi:MAG: hypothetical protein U9Q80_05280 [Bacillota bacterium]|nr:hypothetical protein [Bacillota bacterium]
MRSENTKKRIYEVAVFTRVSDDLKFALLCELPIAIYLIEQHRKNSRVK